MFWKRREQVGSKCLKNKCFQTFSADQTLNKTELGFHSSFSNSENAPHRGSLPQTNQRRNKVKYLNITSVICTLLLVTACSESPEDTVENTIKDVTDSVDNAVEQPNLQGDWKSDCMGSDLIGASFQRKVSFKGNSLKMGDDFYSDSNCKNTLAVEVVYHGDFTVEAINDLKGNIDLNYQKVTVKAVNPEGQELLTDSPLCEDGNWKVGEEKDLTSVSAETFCPLIDTPRKVYDLYELSDDKKFLYFGLGDLDREANEPEDRPEEVDKGSYFTKQ